MPACKYVDKIEHCFKELTEQGKKNTELSNSHNNAKQECLLGVERH